MHRFFDLLAGISLFLVSAYSAFITLFGLPVAVFFGDRNAAFVIIGAGVAGALSALGLPWRQRASARIGVAALGAVSFALLSMRLYPDWTLNFDWVLFQAMVVLWGVAGLVCWRFWSVSVRKARSPAVT